MTLLVDTWASEMRAFQAAGWVFTSYSRYDPTHVEGVTPTGKVFTLHCADGTVTVTVAGNTRNLSVPKETWEPAGGTRTAMLAAYNALPPGQR